MSWVNRILVPVDLSACSLAALRYAAFLGEHDGAQLLVVHVLDAADDDIAGFADELQRERQTRRLRELVAATEAVEAQVVRIEVIKGDPAEVIVEAAKQERVDVIVMGKYGDGGNDLTQGGNVAGRVAAMAPCGVVTVHEPASAAASYALSAFAANDTVDDLSHQVLPLRPVRRSRSRWNAEKSPRLPH